MPVGRPPMSRQADPTGVVRVLIVEDSAADAELMLRALRTGGFAPAYERVESAAAMRETLARQPWDVVLGDYNLPGFDVPAALAVLQEHGQDIPFIVVTGSVGEDAAVAAMKAGATDYIMKDRLQRLAPAVLRAVADAAVRREHQRLQQQLQQSQRLEAVGRLAGGIAHDFNNVLTAILGSVELLLLDTPADAPKREELDIIRDAAARAQVLIRQLLAFSARQVLQPRVLDLNHLVGEVSKMLRRLIGEDVDLVSALARDLGAVRADAAQIEQALVNLAVNARDAGRRGADHRDGKCRVGRRECPDSRRGPAGALRHASGDRHRHRHGRRNPGARLRALLHNQAPRQGDRPWACHRVRDRTAERGPRHGRERAGPGHHVQDLPATCR